MEDNPQRSLLTNYTSYQNIAAHIASIIDFIEKNLASSDDSNRYWNEIALKIFNIPKRLILKPGSKDILSLEEAYLLLEDIKDEYLNIIDITSIKSFHGQDFKVTLSEIKEKFDEKLIGLSNSDNNSIDFIDYASSSSEE